jgi:hypothetical protein
MNYKCEQCGFRSYLGGFCKQCEKYNEIRSYLGGFCKQCEKYNETTKSPPRMIKIDRNLLKKELEQKIQDLEDKLKKLSESVNESNSKQFESSYKIQPSNIEQPQFWVRKPASPRPLSLPKEYGNINYEKNQIIKSKTKINVLIAFAITVAVASIILFNLIDYNDQMPSEIFGNTLEPNEVEAYKQWQIEDNKRLENNIIVFALTVVGSFILFLVLLYILKHIKIDNKSKKNKSFIENIVKTSKPSIIQQLLIILGIAKIRDL